MSTLQQESDVAIGRKRHWWRPLIAAWACALLVGMGLLWSYEATPGRDEPGVPYWPAGTRIARSGDRMTLVMFVHPRCPCTRASLEELQKTLARCQDKLTTWVVFYRPANSNDEWSRTDLWNTAAAIPGVQVLSDADGEEARRFHATTSGQALLYGKPGDLLFAGGLTLARGHEGDNPGRDAIESYVLRGTAKRGQTCVFGCPIVSDTEQRITQKKD